jgi:CIC family chloride channel protein
VKERLGRLAAFLRPRGRQGALVAVVLIGAGCGLVAVTFHGAIELFRRLLLEPALRQPGPFLRGALVVAVPAASGALLAWLLPRFAPRAGGGLALVRNAYGEGPEKLLDARTLAGAFGANALSLGAGTPLGPEGPTVVLTSGFAASAARALRLPGRFVRGMVPVGTAAGIAAIFNAPITGVVFALEEIVGAASRGVLGGALLAAVAAAVVERTFLGGERLLPAAPAHWGDLRELAGFAVLGVLCGLAAGLLPRVVPVLSRGLEAATARAGRAAFVARGAVAGAAAGLLGVAAPESLGIGYPAVAAWLSGGGTGPQAAAAFAAKLAGVALALAAPLVGGVFAPSLFLGASLGAAAGHLGQYLFPLAHVEPGAWALVGMGAFFAGFLRTPIASVLIVFEVTGDYGLVLPQMLAVVLASAVARRLSRETLVERALGPAARRAAAPADPLAGRLVGDAMTTELRAPLAAMSVVEAARAAAGTRHEQFPVVDEEGRLAGVLFGRDLDAAILEGRHAATAGSLALPPVVVLTPGLTLAEAALRLGRAGETRAPVVASEDDPRLVGFLSASDLVRARVEAHDGAGDRPSIADLG